MEYGLFPDADVVHEMDWLNCTMSLACLSDSGHGEYIMVIAIDYTHLHAIDTNDNLRSDSLVSLAEFVPPSFNRY